MNKKMDNTPSKQNPKTTRPKSTKKTIKHPPSNKKNIIRIPKHQMNHSGFSSPKTIDYSKVIEKYGNIIDEEQPKKNTSSSKKRVISTELIDQYKTNYNSIKKTRPRSAIDEGRNTTTNNNTNDWDDVSTYSNMTNRNMTGTNYYSNYDKGSSELLTLKHKLETAEAKISLLEEEKRRKQCYSESNKQNDINSNLREQINLNSLVSQIELLKNKVSLLENENTNLKSRTELPSSNQNISEKVLLLIKLFKKYANKFNQLMPLCELSLTNREYITRDVFDELKETVGQYSNAINNDKLIKIFNIKEVNKEYNNDLSEFEPKPIDLFSKYEAQIKQLKEENIKLNKTIEQFDKRENDEVSIMKAKMKQIQIEKEQLEENVSSLQNINKEYKKKLDVYKEYEDKVKYQNETIQKLNLQIETLENNIKYKEKTISYMEGLLQKIKITPSNSLNNNVSINDNSSSLKKSNRYDNNNPEIDNYTSNEEISNFESRVIPANTLLNKQYFNEDDIIEEEDHTNTQTEKTIPKEEVKDVQQSGHLQNEIDQLDQEIISLKTKLKMMVSNK